MQFLFCRDDMGQRYIAQERHVGEARHPRNSGHTSKSWYVASGRYGSRILTVVGTPEVGASSFVHPSSALLQDLLKEQRASRGTRGPADDTDGLVPQTPDRQSRTRSQSQSQSQEDSTSEKQQKVNSALSAGLRQPREMGVREMDQVGHPQADHLTSPIN